MNKLKMLLGLLLVCVMCAAQGQKSKVYYLGSASTLLACPSYYDENGVWVQVNCNQTTSSYQCTRNHKFTVKQFGAAQDRQGPPAFDGLTDADKKLLSDWTAKNPTVQ